MKQIPYSGPAFVKANGIDIIYDTFGDPGDPPIVLISGLSMQMIEWVERFCEMLASRGYYVIRYDNRDVGLSQKIDELGVPRIQDLFQKVARGEHIKVPYLLSDMADDAVGLLDALGIDSANFVGVSMGGMIAQEIAIHHPERMRSLTSIMSTTGDPNLPQAKPSAMTVVMTPMPLEKERYADAFVQVCRVLKGPSTSLDEPALRRLALRCFERGIHPAGVARQLAAIIASGSRKQALNGVKIPTLVIHGDSDPLVPVECGIDTANAIPGAKLKIIKGVGHELPPDIWKEVVDAISGIAC
ncbi:MAG: alpha/beta hydrolase [Deltaproteobacteria bacterium]|nr:alpha/beta hydrolase [Deltaproteobacteria bacterium]